MPLTARVIEEAEAPTIAETPSWSIQRAAIAVPTSGLFWSSAERMVIGRSPAMPPICCTANWTPATRPWPVSSA